VEATNGRAGDGVWKTVSASTRCTSARRDTLEAVVQLAVEIAREGREGRKIGTLFTVGDTAGVLARSRPLLLDPLYGHPREALHVSSPEFRETVKELAQLDGAFVVDDDGTFVSATRYLDVDLERVELLPGLGTRHAAAASISQATGAVTVVVSQSSVVRVYARAEVRAEIIPELFLLSHQQLFTPKPRVEQVTDAGVTFAVAEG
jgi:diadenylate cyclase